MEVTSRTFGQIENQTVQAYTLKNEQGLTVACLDYGCIITEILAPDKNGVFENVVIGFDSIEDYLADKTFQGAIIGRTAGRIKGGQFDLNGNTYTLEQNENSNHIHGGVKGFDKVIWDSAIIQDENIAGVEFRYVSKDGEGGYPGTVELVVTYALNNQNEFVITIKGVPEADTLINMTNHAYFNLSGDLKRDVLEHELTLKCEQYLELDEESLPTGELIDVSGTVFDFQNGRKIADGTTTDDEQAVIVGRGYDHPFMLAANQDKEIQLHDEKSGRYLVVETNQPAAVVYTSNTMKDFTTRGVEARPYLGICLETQAPPDAIHHENFPSVVVKKGQEYHWETKYTFLTK
ncbi:aldose epimerase family protein [Ferdinandcohnia sp. Marseille-Q9671]